MEPLPKDSSFPIESVSKGILLKLYLEEKKKKKNVYTLVSNFSINHISKNFHISMRMCTKSTLRLDFIIIHNSERAKSRRT